MAGRDPTEQPDWSTANRALAGPPAPTGNSGEPQEVATRAIAAAATVRHWGELLGAAAVALVWLWLVSSRVRTALAPTPHDDALFIQLAGSIASGRWLGGYSNLVLAKGPFYPLWIATCFALNLPLQFAENLLYAAACAAFVVALAPVLRHPASRLALFALLLFSPGAIGGSTHVVRECVYPALTLLVFAGAIGAALQAHRPWQFTRAWAGLFGVALAAFFLCREERIWIAPALVLLMASALARRASWRDLLLTSLVALAAFVVPIGAVMAKNLWRYGTASVSELSDGPFPKAYAALGRVRHAAFRMRVPLPAETRRRIYAVSPRFAELAPYLETDALAGWLANSCTALRICDEIGASHMLWALRDAAALAGHYRSGRDAASYWHAVAAEVDGACENGRLECNRSTGSFLPPWHAQYGPLIVSTLIRTVSYLIRFQDLNPDPAPSFGTAENLIPFYDLTRDRLAPSPDAPALPLAKQAKLDRDRLAVLGPILVAYRALGPVAVGAALVAFLAAAAAALSQRRIGATVLLPASILVAITARLTILVAIDITAFPALNTLYFAPAYPLLIAFVVVALVGLAELIRGRRKVDSIGPIPVERSERG
jgi:hypothetical protein